MIIYAFMDYFQALFSRYEYSVNMHKTVTGVLRWTLQSIWQWIQSFIKQEVYVANVTQLFKSALYFSERLKEELRVNLKQQAW